MRKEVARTAEGEVPPSRYVMVALGRSNSWEKLDEVAKGLGEKFKSTNPSFNNSPFSPKASGLDRSSEIWPLVSAHVLRVTSVCVRG